MLQNSTRDEKEYKMKRKEVKNDRRKRPIDINETELYEQSV